jgi:hypothetical protein
MVSLIFSAQRLAAQFVPRAMSIGDFPMRRIREWGPLGRVRFAVTILVGNLKSQSSVLSLSLGQCLPPRSKTARLCSSSSFVCEAGVACSHVLGLDYLAYLFLRCIQRKIVKFDNRIRDSQHRYQNTHKTCW